MQKLMEIRSVACRIVYSPVGHVARAISTDKERNGIIKTRYVPGGEISAHLFVFLSFMGACVYPSR
jgi:hypothetical protein